MRYVWLSQQMMCAEEIEKKSVSKGKITVLKAQPTNTILKGKDKVGGLILPNFKAVWYW